MNPKWWKIYASGISLSNFDIQNVSPSVLVMATITVFNIGSNIIWNSAKGDGAFHSLFSGLNFLCVIEKRDSTTNAVQKEIVWWQLAPMLFWILLIYISLKIDIPRSYQTFADYIEHEIVQTSTGLQLILRFHWCS